MPNSADSGSACEASDRDRSQDAILAEMLATQRANTAAHERLLGMVGQLMGRVPPAWAWALGIGVLLAGFLATGWALWWHLDGHPDTVREDMGKRFEGLRDERETALERQRRQLIDDFERILDARD